MATDIQCMRCKVFKSSSEFKNKKKNIKEGEPIVLKKYCEKCLQVATNYRNKSKLIRVNIHNLSDEEKKEIYEEVNNTSD